MPATTAPPSVKKTFHFHASASALGGFLDTPVHTVVPVQASAALPTSGGHACVDGGAFNHHNIVSCNTSFSRVSGKHNGLEAEGGPPTSGGCTSQITCIVEGFNLLQVVSIDRVVAQITIDRPASGGETLYSFAGSHFYGLRVAGKDVTLDLEPDIFSSSSSGVSWTNLIEIGKRQATEIESTGSPWAKAATEWMLPKNDPKSKGQILCSLVKNVSGSPLGSCFNHYLDIPNIGKIFFGEVMAFQHSVQLTMMRAELGCHVNGNLGLGVAHGSTPCNPPC